MGNFIQRCCACTQPEDDVLGLLLIGLDGTGKTELAYKICETKRDEYLQTKGCRVFNANIAGTKVQLTEIGGAPEFRDLWKYYFLDMFAVIFVIDASSINNICQSYKIFKNLMAHDFLIGKPFLIIANKQDLPGSVDCIDICEYLDVEFLANKFRNPCMLEACGNWANESNEYDGLKLGINWLVKTIIANKQFLTNRINFHRGMLEHSSKLFQSHRPCTGIRRKSSRFSIRELRPKTAPSEYRSWLRENDNNYLSKRNSVASERSGKSQVTNMGTTETTADSNSNPDELSMVEEVTESTEAVTTMNENHTETIVLITNRPTEDLTVEDLSLTLHNSEANKMLNGIVV
ncbi:ADP-ribosylation factor-like protein 13B [Aedes aegypti]|uniref:ADP-ribosylation factor, putative n=1 Tax=Aedes aegypti TaxID=7159 RepID=A0A1S4FU64_AEDAE|nr:ADP-ribosylation factor-like protein 13B [Aedes aegypti]